MDILVEEVVLMVATAVTIKLLLPMVALLLELLLAVDGETKVKVQPRTLDTLVLTVQLAVTALNKVVPVVHHPLHILQVCYLKWFCDVCRK